MTTDVQRLQDLTLDAVGATSIAHHLQRGERSHFNPEVSDTQRLAELGDLIGKVFEAAVLSPDIAKLQRALLWLSATSAIWAELIDRNPMRRLSNPGGVAAYWTEGKLTDEEIPRFMKGGIIK